MLTPKQNLLAAIYGEKQDYVPSSRLEYVSIRSGMALQQLEDPFVTSKDAFGVPWVVNQHGPMTQPGFVMFDDITEWEDYVHFPNLDDIDFKRLAEEESKMYPANRKEMVKTFNLGGLQFMRLLALMGVENALCAMAMEPEACMDFFEAYTNYRVELISRAIDAFDPDIFVVAEDIATARGLFMSPETYRKLLKPFHKRIIETINSRGVISGFHTCGKCEDVIDDYVEIGIKTWYVGQSVNDIAGILDKHKGVLSIDGGWSQDSRYASIKDDDDGEILREEIRRCLTEYKKPGYILAPMIMKESGHLMPDDPRYDIMRDEYMKHRYF